MESEKLKLLRGFIDIAKEIHNKPLNDEYLKAEIRVSKEFEIKFNKK